MRIEFTVPVITDGKPARTRDARTILASVKRVVDVPEYTTTDVPVALTCWIEAEDDDGNDLGFREFREIDGSLYIDLAPEIGTRDISTMGALHHQASDLPCLPPFHLVGRHIMNRIRTLSANERKASLYPADIAAFFAKCGWVSGPFTDLASLKLESYDQGMVDQCVALFDEAVSGLAFVDGNLHSLERPPVIQVNHWFASIDAKVIRRPMPGPVIRYNDEDGGQNTPAAFFRIDEAEEAIAFARTLPDNGTQPLRFDHQLDIELVPDAPVQFNAASAMVHAVAVAVNDNIVGFFGSNHGRAAIALFASVIEPYRIIERELQTGDEEDVSDELVQALEDIMAMGPEHLGHFVGKEDVVAAFRRALDEWHDRPLSLGIGASTLGM